MSNQKANIPRIAYWCILLLVFLRGQLFLKLYLDYFSFYWLGKQIVLELLSYSYFHAKLFRKLFIYSEV